MKPKKSKEANLENKRFVFFQIGFILALSSALLAFEWTSQSTNSDNPFAIVDEIPDQEQAPITAPEKEVTPPPPPPPIQTEWEIFENEAEIFDLEIKWDVSTTELEAYKITPQEKEKPVDVIPFTPNGKMPKFKGGDIATFQKWVAMHIRYPKEAQDMNIQGTVLVGFIIDKDGHLIGTQVYRSVDPLLDDEALRVINKSPKWKPGKQGTIPVNVSYVLPVKFQLN